MTSSNGKFAGKEADHGHPEVGSPITASQRHSYREAPDSSFYAAYQAAFQAQAAQGGETGTGSGNGAQALENILGATHTELSAMRASARRARQFAAVLNKAYSSGGMDNARQFLSTLSALEMDAVRQNHCLADTIDRASLSEEGAANLLLPEGYSVDLNHDGSTRWARTHRPLPAPGRPGGVPGSLVPGHRRDGRGQHDDYGLMMHDAIYGLQIDGQSLGSRYAADDMDSYREIVSNYLASLEAFKGFLADGQYERDKAFFTRLQTLLAAGLRPSGRAIVAGDGQREAGAPDAAAAQPTRPPWAGTMARTMARPSPLPRVAGAGVAPARRPRRCGRPRLGDPRPVVLDAEGELYAIAFGPDAQAARLAHSGARFRAGRSRPAGSAPHRIRPCRTAAARPGQAGRRADPARPARRWRGSPRTDPPSRYAG
jgi:hypothetical protein